MDITLSPKKKKKKKKEKSLKSPTDQAPPKKKRPSKLDFIAREYDFTGQRTSSWDDTSTTEGEDRYDITDISLASCTAKPAPAFDSLFNPNTNVDTSYYVDSESVAISGAQIFTSTSTSTTNSPYCTPSAIFTQPTITPTFTFPTTTSTTTTTASLISTTLLTYSHGTISHSTPNTSPKTATKTIPEPSITDQFISEYEGNPVSNPKNTVDTHPAGIVDNSDMDISDHRQSSPPITPVQSQPPKSPPMHTSTIYPRVKIKVVHPKRGRRNSSSSDPTTPDPTTNSNTIRPAASPLLERRASQQQRSTSPDTAASSARQQPAPPKPPAIHIYSRKNRDIIKTINQTVNIPPKYKFNNTSLICLPNSPADHNKISKLLTQAKIEYYTHNPVALRPLKIIVKYIPLDVTDEDIKLDLQLKELPLLRIARIMITRDGARCPSNILLLTVPRDYVDQYYALNELCNLRVTVASYIGPALSQCHNCQGFAHSSELCSRKHRCVRCSMSHKGQPCASETCKCANCSGTHPANFRGCPAYQAALKRYGPRNLPDNEPKTPPPIDSSAQFPPLPQTAPINVTKPPQNHWASSTRSKPSVQPKPPAQGSESSNPFREIIEIFKQFNLGKIWNILKIALEKIKRLKDPIEKILVLIEAGVDAFSNVQS